MDNHSHTAKDRIIRISKPYLRPIVRGKARSPVEFGAKLDISIANGFARLETFRFDPYFDPSNEAGLLKDVIERYFQRNARYPERVLADKIYRNRGNLHYCKEQGIRLSGLALGRLRQDATG